MGKPLGQRIAEAESKTNAEHPLDAHTEEMLQDLLRVQEEFPDKFLTRELYRKHGAFNDYQWGSRFGTFKEYRRTAGLELNRGAQRIEKAIATHSARDRYRGFFEVEILPWVGKYEKKPSKALQTILVGSDFHDIDADPFVLSVFLETAKRIQPSIIVLAGDVFDLYEFSRFDHDPRLMNLKERFEFVKDKIFRPLRENCPNAQIDFILGNHDLRLLRHMADRTPYLAPLLDLMGVSLNQIFGLDAFKINLVSKGDFSAYQPKEAREEARKNYKKYFNTICIGHEPQDYGMCSVSGHTHKPEFKAKVSELMGSYFNLVLGCIAKTDVEYVAGLNPYNQGFALLHVDPCLREVIPEQIIFTDHMAVIGGVVYRRPQDGSTN
jgi:predicted phosphodiesterase